MKLGQVDVWVGQLTKGTPEATEANLAADAAVLKHLKSFAKQGDENVDTLFDSLWTALLTNSSSVRFSAHPWAPLH